MLCDFYLFTSDLKFFLLKILLKVLFFTVKYQFMFMMAETGF